MKKLLKILAVILILVEIFALTPKTMQNDTFWSIKVGEELFKNGKITEDTLGQNEGLNYVAQHYFTDIAIYFAYEIGGMVGLYIFELLLVCCLAVVLYILNKQISKNTIFSYLMLIIELFLLAPHFAVRAQMVSFLLFIIELILLEKIFEKYSNKYIFGLCVIPILLANLHMGVVPFYFIILGVYGIGCIKSKKDIDKKLLKALIITGVIGLITIFMNPYFIDGVIYPFKTLGNDFINNYIEEFNAFSLESTYGKWVLFYIFVLVALMILLNNKIQIKDYLLIFGTLLMNFIAIRYTSFFIICSIVIIRYLDLNELFTKQDIMNNKWIIFSVMIVSIFVFLVRGYIMFNDSEIDNSNVYPKEAIEYIVKNKKDNMVIFNKYTWGAGLMLNGIKPFIDSRCDMYTKEYNDTTVADDYVAIYSLGNDFDKLIESYGFNTFLVETDSSFSRILKLYSEYELVYEDELASVFVVK